MTVRCRCSFYRLPAVLTILLANNQDGIKPMFEPMNESFQSIFCKKSQMSIDYSISHSHVHFINHDNFDDLIQRGF